MSKLFQIIIICLCAVVAILVINHTTPNAFGRPLTQETITASEKNYIQIAFCFGGYSYMLNVAEEDNNDVLSAKLDRILKTSFDTMNILQFSITEQGSLDGIWGEMFDIARDAEIMNGFRYVRKVGAVEFIPDMTKCSKIIDSVLPK